MTEEELKAKLGRLIVEDSRDANFPMKSMLPKKLPEITYKYWNPNGWWGNQGETSQCVAFSWVHWLAEGPILQKGINGNPPFDTSLLYNEAQKVDQWEGEEYDGTSVRAGASVLRTNGYISKYSWAWDLDTTISALLTLGPVVVGTYWYYDMFFPNDNGIITATGNIMGGHAYLLDGVNIKKKLIRIKNSWGRNWGKKGFAYISFDDMSKLIKNQGEVCLATEIKK